MPHVLHSAAGLVTHNLIANSGAWHFQKKCALALRQALSPMERAATGVRGGAMAYCEV